MKLSQKALTSSGRLLRSVLILGLIWGITGCASITSHAATEEPVSAVSGCDAKKVTITSVHWFQEKDGAWRVVGVISNHSSKAVSKLVTGVETRTSNDLPADQGEDISAYPLDLKPGQQAPFTAWIDRQIPGLDHFEVEVDECVLAEPAERAEVVERGGRLIVDETGTAQVTAELYNPGPKTVLVNGLMAAVYDRAGALITAQYADVTPRYLAPGESGPVRASMDLPGGPAGLASSYKLFMDVLVNSPTGGPALQARQDIQLLSHYTDRAGHFHLVGVITNPTSQDVMTSWQATVYSDSSKSQVVDAAQLSSWVPLKPGGSLPFDLAGWGPLNTSRGSVAPTSGGGNFIQMRFEPFLTWTTQAEVKNLTLSEAKISFQDQQAFFTGKVTNDGEGGITSGLVTAVLRQKSSGQIVAVGNTHLGITDSAAPGQVLPYSITVPLPQGTDPAGLESELTAEGYEP